MFIYKIVNTVNDKIYIGQTVQKNPKARWYDHTACVRKGKNSHLYNSMRKYGVENFVWQVIDQAESLDDLNAKEKYWLDFFRAESDVYNKREAGNNKIHAPESIEKMRESQRQAHARRRALGTDTWTRIDGGGMKGKVSPKKGKPSTKWSEEAKARHSVRCIEREQRKKLLRDKEI
jgi:group I intron endonuclease